MSEYFVTFEPGTDPNTEFSIEFRGKLEDLAPKNWYQVFTFQIAIRTRLTVEQLSAELSKVTAGRRFTIVKVSSWFYSDSAISSEMENAGF